MAKQSWLMQALNDASKQAQELPRWARDVNSAVDDFYNRSAPQSQDKGVTSEKDTAPHTEFPRR